MASDALGWVGYGQSGWGVPFQRGFLAVLVNWVVKMVNRKMGKLEVVFIDKEGKWFSVDEVDEEDLAGGLGKVFKEVVK